MAIALVDVNNFYASCERLFRPELRGRPIVVLSNNDGCVVSRSPEAKAMGIKMAGPYFKIREQFEAHGGVAFSSNYALYGDMSGRVMSTLETMSPELEVYSIDKHSCHCRSRLPVTSQPMGNRSGSECGSGPA
ncbi:hypothetical protein PYU98_03035 [Aeromonas allosaccharophila]|uniref:UmuC domain-containing protein n=1 Tax=Aeromonas allosaccharophila TaxID=656 RepID=A0AAX3NUE7_9GAMM|nr:hypothetical protein [Aeromonas allosaccharophila]WED77256.1 hypothetical protein PYU98_03035 [Aeromonas allosaccharophila]